MPVDPTTHQRDRFKPRKDKALLLNAGRLMERRENRELDELTAQIASLEKQLEEARAASASTAALSTTTGGSAVKQLQKEVSELKCKLSEAEAERDAATFAKESLERQDSRQGGGGGEGGSKQLQRELEESAKRLKAVEAELESARQEARKLQEQQVRSYAANGRKMDAAERAEYEEAMERVNVRLQTLEEKLAEEEKRTEIERHIERARQATRRAESAEDNLANARALAQTAKSAQKEVTALKKEKEQVEARLIELERTCADLQRALSETQDDLAEEKVLVGRLPREAQQRLGQAEKRHREEEQRLKKQLATITDRCALICQTLQLKEADVATIFTRGDTPLGRDLCKHGLRGIWSAYRDAQDSVVFLKTQVSSLASKVEDLQAQLDEQDHQSLPGSWPGTDDAAAAKAEIDRLKGELHAATLELANEKTRSTELRTQAAAESASLRERIARLEAQCAFWLNLSFTSHAHRLRFAGPATPRSESAAPTASSTAQSRLVIERLTKTVEELNKQNAVLRNENSPSPRSPLPAYRWVLTVPSDAQQTSSFSLSVPTECVRGCTGGRSCMR
ncbi:RHTO0S04e04104g1_1 [Rhodotorula toruloides]|uniref:RHTO0S04e04104g1_1 n=1 Tax=Rhodotorula toruloides TaxID=5286 RepID=A0A061AVC6_RHOTO|nr:RHTO0S04e04104g1_1 [Rhodotorula toruloides]